MLALGIRTGDSIVVQFIDDFGVILDSVTIAAVTFTQAIWGAFNWGQANWGASQSGLQPVTIPWNQTVVFNRLSIMGQGPSSLGLKIGAYRVGYKRLRYLLN